MILQEIYVRFELCLRVGWLFENNAYHLDKSREK